MFEFEFEQEHVEIEQQRTIERIQPNQFDNVKQRHAT